MEYPMLEEFVAFGSSLQQKLESIKMSTLPTTKNQRLRTKIIQAQNGLEIQSIMNNTSWDLQRQNCSTQAPSEQNEKLKKKTKTRKP